MGGIVDAVFGGGNKAPSPPDPIATANAQGAANIDAARITTALNRANQITPWGNLTWAQGGSGFDQTGYDNALKAWQDAGSTGSAPAKKNFGYDPDAWTSTVTLDPRMQSLLDSNLATSRGLQSAINNSLAATTNTLSQPLNTPDSINIGNIRNGVEGRYTDLQPSLQGSTNLAALGRGDVATQLARLRNLYSQDFNYNSAPAMPTADKATRQRVEDALYGRSTARLDPRFAQGQDQLNSSLAAQGLTQGSEAYNRELQNFNNAKNDAYSSAMNDAISGSDDAMQRIFNMGMQARQQGVNEANTLRALPTQEAAALAGISNGLDTSSRNWYGAETAQETSKDNSTANEFNLQRTNNQDKFNNTIAMRNQILNELNALRTGAQAQAPNFASTQSGANVAASPVAQSVYNSYQGALANYNAQVGSNNAMLGGLAGLGGAAMMAPAGTFAGLAALF